MNTLFQSGKNSGWPRFTWITRVFYAFFICSLPIASNAQIHLKGISGIEAGGGINGIGTFGSLTYVKFLSPKMHYSVGGLAEFGKHETGEITYQSFGLNGKFYYTPFSLGEAFFINLSGGGFAAFENYTGFNELEDSQKNRAGGINYGIGAGLHLEYYFSSKIAAACWFTQEYNFGKSSGNLRYRGGLGIRYFFL